MYNPSLYLHGLSKDKNFGLIKSTQRTSGVNAHLIHGIYSNTFIYVYLYSPRAGAEHLLGTKF